MPCVGPSEVVTPLVTSGGLPCLQESQAFGATDILVKPSPALNEQIRENLETPGLVAEAKRRERAAACRGVI